MDRKVPLWLLILVVFLGINALVMFGWSVRRALIVPGVEETPIGALVLAIASYPSLVKDALYGVGLLTYGTVTKDEEDLPPQLIPNEFPELDGFKKNGTVQAGALKDNGYLLLSFWDFDRGQSVVQLIRIRDQQILHEWGPDLKHMSTVADRYIDPIWLRMVHPLLLDNGSLIFHGEAEDLVRIDACSNIEWLLKGEFHHAIEQDGEGNIWVGSRIKDNYYANLMQQRNYHDDSIAKVSLDGKLLFEKSVTKILEKSGYFGLVFGIVEYRADMIHLNDIQPLIESTSFGEKGDLLLSIRRLSTVLQYRPSTDEIVWLKTGPWLHQHDVDVISKSEIAIFSNNTLRTKRRETDPIIGGHNRIYVVNMSERNIDTPYDTAMKSAEVRTRQEGLQEFLPDGDIMVEETLRGRLLRISTEGVVWEFTVPAGNNAVSLTHWSRYLIEEDVKDILPVLESANCK